MKKSSLSLHFLKNNIKIIKDICEENASELKCLNKNLFKSY